MEYNSSSQNLVLQQKDTIKTYIQDIRNAHLKMDN